MALLRSVWSEPTPALAERAFEHHAAAYSGWLQHSGAEGRLALVLSSGPQATERLLRSLSTTRVEVVRAPSTPARPLHPQLAKHSGDHFNHTLYVVDGFDAGDPGAQLDTLDGQRSMLKKMATWVAIIAESPHTVAAIERHAPNLWNGIERRVLALHPEMLRAGIEPLDAETTERWRAQGRVAEGLHHYALTPHAAPAYHDFARFVRAGYVPLVVGAEQHPDRARLAAMWAGDDVPLEDAGPAVLDAAVRHRGATIDPARVSPEARLAAGWPLPDHSVFEALRRVQTLEAPDDDAVGALEALVAVDGVGAGVRTHAALAVAAAHAACGDLDRCRGALEVAVRHAGAASVAPEVRFDALEKLAQVHTFTHQRGPARALVDRLELLAPRLHAPFYAARFRLARGEFVAPLDAHRAEADLSLARTLFAGHGYPMLGR